MIHLEKISPTLALIAAVWLAAPMERAWAQQMLDKPLSQPCAANSEVAPDTLTVNPHIVSVLFENESIRVLEVVNPPGGVEDWHSHPPYMVYVVEGGHLQVTKASGEISERDIKTGSNRLLDAVLRHKGQNIGETTLRLILVEMKRGLSLTSTE